MTEKLRPSWVELESENCSVEMTLLFCSKDLKWHLFFTLFSVLCCSLTKVTLYFLAPDFLCYLLAVTSRRLKFYANYLVAIKLASGS